MFTARFSPMRSLVFGFLVAFSSFAALAAEPVNTLEKSGFIGFKPSGVAIRGADPVGYFTEGKYLPGSDAYTAEWNGATWKFASAANRDLFVAEPEMYAPQYGGYCAYGVAKGSLVKIEPENWSVVDGKLYLNFSNSVQKKWEKDVSGFIATADQSFAALLNE